MRHRKAGFKLGRTTPHRQAMLRNLAVALFEHGQIVTTEQKAKAVQPMVEKIVTLAKRGDLHSRRLVAQKLGHDRKAFSWLYLPSDATEQERESHAAMRERAEQFFDIPDDSTVERNRYGELRKCPTIVKHIFDNVAPRFEDRAGGYTRVLKLGKRRIGDAAEYCVLQFVGAEDGPEIGGNPSKRRRKADRRTAYFADIKKQWGSGDEATAVAEEEPAVDSAQVEESQVEESQAEAPAEGGEETKD